MLRLLTLLMTLTVLTQVQAQAQGAPFADFSNWAEQTLAQNPVQKSEMDEDYVTFSGRARGGESCQIAITRKQANLYYLALGQAERGGVIENWIGVSIGEPTRFQLDRGTLQIRQASVKPGADAGQLERTGVIEMTLSLQPQGPASAALQWQRPNQKTIRWACTFAQ